MTRLTRQIEEGDHRMLSRGMEDSRGLSTRGSEKKKIRKEFVEENGGNQRGLMEGKTSQEALSMTEQRPAWRLSARERQKTSQRPRSIKMISESSQDCQSKQESRLGEHSRN